MSTEKVGQQEIKGETVIRSSADKIHQQNGMCETRYCWSRRDLRIRRFY